ncbi:hypothetical protein AQUCO_00600402v1 [Aquilegia coerulea]|uniref:Cytochrome P450 n=1 Tax=Aquilegia coerulea TaxID=218851 RepID=A0A2G5EPF8_AQUCA|nr:hypothetical protein AQUCO_00600402v1 [Aquilegia coerulea]
MIHIYGEKMFIFSGQIDLRKESPRLLKTPINAYLPFGMGPRNCVGSNFATIEVKLAFSMILQRYAFTLSPSYFTTHPQHGVQIVLHAL